MTIMVNRTFTEEDVLRIKDKVGRVKLGYVKRDLVVGHSRWPFKPKEKILESKYESHPKGITEFYARHHNNFTLTLESREVDGFGDLCRLVRRFDKGDRSFCVDTDILDVLQRIEDGIDD